MTNKTVHFIRHGEGVHNIAYYLYDTAAYFMEEYRDPELTETGKDQAILARYSKPELQLVDMVLVSPLMRTMQTADIIFKNHSNVHALSLIKEANYEHTCNQSKSTKDLRPLFPHVNYKTIDIDVFDQLDNKQKDLQKCFAILDQMLKQSEYKKIAIVSHHDFICEFMKFKLSKPVCLNNCEIYTIVDYQ